MNVQTASQSRIPIAASLARPATARPVSYREPARSRDFGIGYGRSSGYGTARRYADNWGNDRFRCG